VTPVDAPVSWSINEVMPPVRLEAERLFQLFPAAPLPKEKSIRRSMENACHGDSRRLNKSAGRNFIFAMGLTYTFFQNFNPFIHSR